MAIQKKDSAQMDCRPSASGSDLTGKEHYLCVRTSAGDVRLAQAGEIVAGVIQEGKAATYWTSFMTGGIAKVVASQAITPGLRVQAGADGTVVAGSTNSFGVSRNSVASGEMCEVVIDHI